VSESADGDVAPEINTTWLGLVGPDVRHEGVNNSLWSDHTDIQPTMMGLLGAAFGGHRLNTREARGVIQSGAGLLAQAADLARWRTSPGSGLTTESVADGLSATLADGPSRQAPADTSGSAAGSPCPGESPARVTYPTQELRLVMIVGRWWRYPPRTTHDHGWIRHEDETPRHKDENLRQREQASSRREHAERDGRDGHSHAGAAPAATTKRTINPQGHD
jgi:hypothetical protein